MIDKPLTDIKGVGPRTATQLADAGLVTVRDLIDFLPRTFEDYSNIVSIANITPGKCTIRARCESIATRRVRRGMTVTTATLVDETGKLRAVWFNQPYRASQFAPDDEYFFSGVFEFSYNRHQLTNPSAEKVSAVPISTDRIVPVYRAVKGLKSQLVRKILHELKPFITMLPETLPAHIVTSQRLLTRSEAMLNMHFPKSVDVAIRAKERLGFEELFQLLLASQLNKQVNAKLRGWQIPFDVDAMRAFVARLPFTLTTAQRRVAWDIVQDFEKAEPMNRLVQGDVGSGKTVVAAIAAYQAAQAGFQTAVMAPTELLAAQHAATFHTLLEPFGVKVALLTGSVKGAARKQLYVALADGSIDVVIGTHALIQDTVTFHKLGFVAIDEQHRFGVKQRQALLGKSAHMPHLLSMTATPIPRSLALTLYGELAISIINEKPKNRVPIVTKLWSPVSRAQLYAAIDAELTRGRQGYIICRLIDDNPSNDAKSVQAEFKRLQNSLFTHRRIGLLHGRLSSAEKESVMQAFASGQLDLLVSTTVVEVGVDVPNATVMLIEDADLYGLSQLHQLRGRVGRSAHQSYCYLLTSDTKAPSQRLKEIEHSNDGFYLAEVDLRLRGPGEIYGRAQHGALNLQVATLADTRLIARAQEAVQAFLASGDDLLDYKELAAHVQRYQRLTTLN